MQEHQPVNQIRYEIHHCTLSDQHVSELIPLRLELFYHYPYLYSGTAERERLRWQNTPQDSTILVLAYDNRTLVGALLAYAEDASNHRAIASLPSYKPDSSLYLEFAMVVPTYQRRGIARELLRLFEIEAVHKGYADVYDITVVRSRNHPFKPENELDLDVVWQNMGFQKMNIYQAWNWPTRCGVPGNEFVAPIDNMVQYWHKKL